MLRMLKARLNTADYFKQETNTAINTELDEEKQISQKCLGVPTVLREILRHLSTEELIKLSLVNKVWSFEARSVMKERGNLTAITPSLEDDPCKNLVAFASDLAKMRVIPFTGIYVHMHHRCAWEPTVPLDPSSKVILNQLLWKRFAVNLCGWWKHCHNCPALMLLKEILEDFCGVLVELSLTYETGDFFQSICFHDLRLPCLKTIKMKRLFIHSRDEPVASAFIKMLVYIAPNLQELHLDGDIRFEENLLEGSSVVIVQTRTFRPLRRS